MPRKKYSASVPKGTFGNKGTGLKNPTNIPGAGINKMRKGTGLIGPSVPPTTIKKLGQKGTGLKGPTTAPTKIGKLPKATGFVMPNKLPNAPIKKW